VPGLSEEVYSLIAFYERGGFEMRVSATKRDDFLSEDRGGSNSLTDVTRSGTELVDAQISYDFADSSSRWLSGLRISLQGQNLTDEDDVTTDDQGRVTKVETYGRNFLLTFNYSFW
jgi:iron complex outermembrane receptor protein